MMSAAVRVGASRPPRTSARTRQRFSTRTTYEGFRFSLLVAGFFSTGAFVTGFLLGGAILPFFAVFFVDVGRTGFAAGGVFFRGLSPVRSYTGRRAGPVVRYAPRRCLRV